MEGKGPRETCKEGEGDMLYIVGRYEGKRFNKDKWGNQI
jgi:hypothetical protein